MLDGFLWCDDSFFNHVWEEFSEYEATFSHHLDREKFANEIFRLIRDWWDVENEHLKEVSHLKGNWKMFPNQSCYSKDHDRSDRKTLKAEKSSTNKLQSWILLKYKVCLQRPIAKKWITSFKAKINETTLPFNVFPFVITISIDCDI